MHPDPDLFLPYKSISNLLRKMALSSDISEVYWWYPRCNDFSKPCLDLADVREDRQIVIEKRAPRMNDPLKPPPPAVKIPISKTIISERK
jgi:hypothetical protein